MPDTSSPGSSSSSSQFLAQSPLLASVRDLANGLTAADRRQVATQLQLLFRDYYVHLPLKRSSLGIDPVQEAAILVDDAQYFTSDVDFHARILDLVCRLRDRHTAVHLPSPWRDMVAFLPFSVESCFDGQGRHLLVTKTMTDLGDPGFVPGVEITHWNGSSIRRYVESVSVRSPGGNPFARIAVALRSLTARPLGYMLPPDEDWVVLNYRGLDGSCGTVCSPWYVYCPVTSYQANPSSGQGWAATLGLDRSTLQVNGAWFDLYSRQGAVAGATPSASTDPLANLARWQAVHTDRGDFGYIRLFSFDAPDPAAFVQRFAEVLAGLPQDGVVIDLRANPGGTIPAGEALMRLFTPDEVSPQPVSFRNTEAVRRLGGLPMLAPWKRSLEMYLDTGEVFSQGYPLGTGQVLPRPFIYRGVVVLVIDALCYSTTDFFSAGMQDNGLATLIGVDPVTGAGGANVWSYGLLRDFVQQTGGSLEPLPANFDIDLSMRRSIRVGRNEGLPVEGSGVFAEIQYGLTRADVIGSNNDLAMFACGVLANIRDQRRR